MLVFIAYVTNIRHVADILAYMACCQFAYSRLNPHKTFKLLKLLFPVVYMIDTPDATSEL
jgi:hypothetical protein